MGPLPSPSLTALTAAMYRLLAERPVCEKLLAEDEPMKTAVSLPEVIS